VRCKLSACDVVDLHIKQTQAMIKKLTGLTASVVALASTASANVKINDYLSVEGYAVASLTTTDPDTGKGNDTSFDSGSNNLDSINIAILGSYKDFGGKVSLEYVPNSVTGESAELLDIYATYTAGSVTVTGGKFLSYLGYEAYHPVAMTQLTYGSSIFAIPGYHTGAKVDFAVSDTLSLGASVTDSLFPGSTAVFGDKGDGDFSDGLGYEFIATYTGIEKLTVFVGLGLDDDDAAASDYVFDIWASYALTDKLTLGAEYDYLEDAGHGYLFTAQYAFTDKVSLLTRWSAAHAVSGDTGTYLTLSPTYVLTENLSVRAEVSYADSAEASSYIGDKGFFYGAQGVFKF
jgi:hypothetical protein